LDEASKASAVANPEVSVQALNKPEIFSIDRELMIRFPSISVGVAIIRNAKIEKTNTELEKAKEEVLKSLEGLTTEELGEFSDVEKKFFGFITQAGSTGERYSVGTMQGVNVDADLKKIAKQLYKIRHWEIKLGSYDELENVEATWFIDPPYEFGGHEYKCSNKNIDFDKLAEWCKERNGQAIVCENTKATWLPFKPMKEMQGTMFKTTEAIWSNLKTNYDNEQILLQF
jgi:16S rRNA G966 N2-methylase RsmD